MGSLAALSTVQLLFVGCTIQACPVCVAWALAALAEFKQLQCVLVKVRHKCVAGRDTPNCRPGDLPRSSMAPVFRDYFFLSLFFFPKVKAKFHIRRASEGSDRITPVFCLGMHIFHICWEESCTDSNADGDFTMLDMNARLSSFEMLAN